MSSTISASAHAREPVTLCYKRRYRLLTRKPDSHPPLPPAPSSYPCPPLYRNQHRLPFIEQQWYRETLQDAARYEYEEAEWSVGEEVKEVKADWQWSIARLIKKICRADGVQLLKGKARGMATEEGDAEDGKEEAEEKVADGEAGEDEGQTPLPLVIQVDSLDTSVPSPELLSGRTVSLSSGRLSDEEADDADAHATAHAPHLRLAVNLDEHKRPSTAEDERAALSPRPPSGLILSPLSPSSRSSVALSPSATPRTARRSLTPSQSTVLASFNALPAVFVPSVRVTCGGRTRVVRLGGGGGVRLAEVRGEWKWGVREGGRVGMWCTLEVYGYVLWVKEEPGKGNAWAKQLSSHVDEDKGHMSGTGNRLLSR